MRLDRLLSNQGTISRQRARRLLLEGRVSIDGHICRDGQQAVSAFMRVCLDEHCLQAGKVAHYYMLHKPAGYLSATTDPQHPTVLELLPASVRGQLHLAGRLDRSTTGLLLLSNDGLWTRHLTLPDSQLAKRYRVETCEAISPLAQTAFTRGIYLAREALWTRPAELQQLSSHTALLTIYEGRHHQIKRMFHAVGNRVCRLHRESMGPLQLDPDLPPGAWRALSEGEIQAVWQCGQPTGA
jgi:16S rRNA pseudouridine516 synthase